MNDELSQELAHEIVQRYHQNQSMRGIAGATELGDQEPVLVLFSGSVQSACGMADSAVGPFYCPADSKVYIDLSFFEELSGRELPGTAT